MVDPQCSPFHASFVCVCPERCVQVYFLVWAGVAVGWFVDFEFTSQRLFFWFGLVLPLVGWLIPSCHCMLRAGRVYAELYAGP